MGGQKARKTVRMSLQTTSLYLSNFIAIAYLQASKASSIKKRLITLDVRASSAGYASVSNSVVRASKKLQIASSATSKARNSNGGSAKPILVKAKLPFNIVLILPKISMLYCINDRPVFEFILRTYLLQCPESLATLT